MRYDRPSWIKEHYEQVFLDLDQIMHVHDSWDMILPTWFAGKVKWNIRTVSGELSLKNSAGRSIQINYLGRESSYGAL